MESFGIEIGIIEYRIIFCKVVDQNLSIIIELS